MDICHQNRLPKTPSNLALGGQLPAPLQPPKQGAAFSSLGRCYSFGIGPHACRRLVQGAAAVSRGIAEFLVEGERLQPKVRPRAVTSPNHHVALPFPPSCCCCFCSSHSAAGGRAGGDGSILLSAGRGSGRCLPHAGMGEAIATVQPLRLQSSCCRRAEEGQRAGIKAAN